MTHPTFRPGDTIRIHHVPDREMHDTTTNPWGGISLRHCGQTGTVMNLTSLEGVRGARFELPGEYECTLPLDFLDNLTLDCNTVLVQRTLHDPEIHDLDFLLVVEAPFGACIWNRDDVGNNSYAVQQRAARCRAWLERVRQYHDHVQGQLNAGQQSSRIPAAWEAWKVLAARAALRALGEAVSKFLLDESDASDLIDALNGLKSLSDRLARRAWDSIEDIPVNASGSLTISNYIARCDNCGALYDADDGHAYLGESDDEFTACDDCANDPDALVWSEAQDIFIARSYAHNWYSSYRELNRDEPSDFCTRSWGRRNGHPCEDRPGYADTDAYEEYYGEDDDDGLMGYHGSSRSAFFRERVGDTSPTALPALGVELEVWAEDRAAAVSGMRDALPWIYERDSSLDDYHGFEIVSPPMGYAEWQSNGAVLIQALADNEIAGYNAKDGMYGIHVNLHRRHLSPLQEARIMMFMCSEANSNFVRAVAQRRACYGSTRVDMGALTEDRQKVSQVGGLSPYAFRDGKRGKEKKIYGIGKYAPVNWKESIAEFRIFQSTTYGPSFFKNLEFIWALAKFTSTEACTGLSWHHEDFVRWLAAEENAAERKLFPNLVAYLVREKYVIKGGSARSPILNTWSAPLVRRLRMDAASAGVNEGESEEQAREVELEAA